MNKVKQKEYKTFFDLFFPRTEKYSVIVVDDEEYFNKMLMQSLEDFASNLKILYQAQIKLYSFMSAESFIRNIRNHQFKNTRTVFFIDYFLGKNSNATDILKEIKNYPNNRVVIVSEKKNNQTALQTFELGASHFIRKDQFTNFMCTTMLEEFIREDAANS